MAIRTLGSLFLPTWYVVFSQTSSFVSTAPVMTNSSLRFALVFLSAWLGFCSFLQAPIQADEADSDFTFAAGFYRKGRWQYSADAFKKFLADYPNHSRATMARLYYGLSLNSLEKYAESREQLLEFVKADPDNRYAADAKYRIAEDSYYLKDSAAAVAQFEAYLADHDGHGLNAWARLLLGESYNRLESYAKAEAALRPLVNLPPPANIVADSTYALAEAMQGQNRFDDASKYYEDVVNMKSDSFSHKALFRVARIHYDNRDFAKAAAAYDRLGTEFSDKPLAATAIFQAGVARFQMKQFEQAYVQFEKVPKNSEAARYVGLWKGLCLRDAGRLPDARKTFASALKEAGESPIAAEIMFHRAQLEVLDGEKAVAAQMYMDLADRWPQNSAVAESLFNAAELKMELQELDVASRVLNRLQTDFPQKAKAPQVLLLQGRLLLNQGNAEEAVAILQSTLDMKSGSPAEALGRNYHLIRALYRSKQFAEAVETYEPLQELFATPDAASYWGAISLAAVSSLELKDYAKAEQYADDYLKLELQPEKTPDALATRAIAASHLKKFPIARSDLAKLTTDFAENPQTWMAVLQAAEAAWQQKDYAQAAEFFELAATQKDNRSLQAALSGAGWSYYRLENFEKSNELFERIQTEFPGSNEAAYMLGMGLFKVNKSAAAADRFSELFAKLQKLPEATSSPEQVVYFLESGRMSARILGEAGQVERANEAWESLTKTFAASKQLDAMLDEWARLNLLNEQYERSDEIYRQLLDKFPESKFAGGARLSLAESDMQAGRLDAALKEFTAIATNETYTNLEKEAALFHVVDIHAARRDWDEVARFAETFGNNYGASANAPMVQLLYAEALLDKKRFPECHAKIDSLKAAIVDGRLGEEEWTERVWVVLAELALAEKRYPEVDAAAEQLEQRVPNSRFLFQVRDVQGRRWKNQAPPDFVKSRNYFLQVVQDKFGRGTETAARCQFLIGETLLMEDNLKSAVVEYHRVYHLYEFDGPQADAFNDIRARSLFQAAQCEVSLGSPERAVVSYEDLIEDFPTTEWAEKAKPKLTELKAAG